MTHVTDRRRSSLQYGPLAGWRDKRFNRPAPLRVRGSALQTASVALALAAGIADVPKTPVFPGLC